MSIDQCFLSGFARARPEMLPLLDELRRLVTAGKLRCPCHDFETMIEASICPIPATRDRIVAIANELSLGVAFMRFDLLVALDSLSLVRPNMIFPRLVESRLVQPEEGWEIAGEKNLSLKNEFNRSLFASADPPNFRRGMAFEAVRDIVMDGRAASMIRVLEILRGERPRHEIANEWEVTANVGDALLDLHISPDECEALKEKILSREWDCTGALFAHTCLGSLLEFDRLSARTRSTTAQRRLSNDFFDVLRVAVGVTESGIVLCDSRTRSLVARSKLCEIWDHVKVFGSDECDAALAHFQSLG